MRFVPVYSVVCAAALATACSPLMMAGPTDGTVNMKATFVVAKNTQVPGLVLKPGSYTIRVLDHLSDRVIVRVDNAAADKHSTFIGLPNGTLSGNGEGLIPWGSGPSGNVAARGFGFANGVGIEFVYPKADAVAIAKLNGNKVVAIDPASEGRVASKGNLSKDDMEMVTLWTLSSTTVGPNDKTPAIAAARYSVPAAVPPPAITATAPATPAVAPAPIATPNVQVASVTPPPPPPVRRKPVVARLPHTASYLPLLALFSLLSLAGASGMRLSAVPNR